MKRSDPEQKDFTSIGETPKKKEDDEDWMISLFKIVASCSLLTLTCI